MTLAEDDEKNEVGSKLESYKSSITNSVSILKSYKKDLASLRTDMQSKPNIFTAAHLTEVDAILTSLDNQVTTI